MQLGHQRCCDAHSATMPRDYKLHITRRSQESLCFAKPNGWHDVRTKPAPRNLKTAWFGGGWPSLSIFLTPRRPRVPHPCALCKGGYHERILVGLCCDELGSRIYGVGSIVPALAENARAGHPQLWPLRQFKGRVAQPFDFPDATTTEGGPPLRSLQGWVPRAYIGWALLR
jgi:hypothetical protein